MPIKSLGKAAGIAYGASAEIAFDMKPDVQYQLVCTTNAWLLIAPTGGTAVKQAANNHAIPAFVPIPVGAEGTANRCILIQDTAAGFAQLSEVTEIP